MPSGWGVRGKRSQFFVLGDFEGRPLENMRSNKALGDIASSVGKKSFGFVSRRRAMARTYNSFAPSL